MTAQISAYAGWCPLLKSEPRTSGTCMAMDHLYNAVAKHHKGDLVRMAVRSKAIRLLRTVYSVPERYAQEVKQGNRVKLRMPCAVPMSNNRPRLGMKDATRRLRMKMIFD